MRKVNYEQFRKEIIERSKSLGLIHLQSVVSSTNRACPGTLPSRAIRTKPRDPVELEILLKLSSKRKKEALETGEYEIISPRRWRIHGRYTNEAQK